MNKRRKFIAIFNDALNDTWLIPAQSRRNRSFSLREMTTQSRERLSNPRRSPIFSAGIITRPYCEFLIDDAISSHNENYIIIIIIIIMVIIMLLLLSLFTSGHLSSRASYLITQL